MTAPIQGKKVTSLELNLHLGPIPVSTIYLLQIFIFSQYIITLISYNNITRRLNIVRKALLGTSPDMPLIGKRCDNAATATAEGHQKRTKTGELYVANKPNRSAVNHKLLPTNHPVVRIMDRMRNSQRVSIIALVSVIGMACPCEITLSRLLLL